MLEGKGEAWYNTFTCCEGRRAIMDRNERARYLARRRRRRTNRLLTVLTLLLIVAAILLIAIFLLQNRDAQPSAPETTAPAQTVPSTAKPPATTAPTLPPETTQAPETTVPPTTEPIEAPQDESWKLILVNAEHPLPEGYTVTLKELRNGHSVDERIYPELQQMFDDARAAGIYPLINESYRTTERQQQIMDKYIADYVSEGMSREDAEKKAREYVALPGTSEHELGLALDIIAEYEDDSSETWQWLKNNSWKYGFILRYPADKTEITGISYEPWHFRYVGQKAAKEITELGICLEEYLDE